LLRALEPPHAPPPAVRAALVKDLSGLVAGSGIKAAAAATWLKVSLLAVLGVGAAGGLWWSHANSAPVEPSVAPREQPQVAPSPVVVAPPLPPVVAPPVASVVAPAPEPAKSAGSSAPRDSLAEEEALLEAARQAVARSPAQALALLQKHRNQFPSGQLSAERMYLSVDCWQRLGNLPAAKREAAALAKYYPNSAYARRAPLLLASPAR
jgi:TolA-binding protein